MRIFLIDDNQCFGDLLKQKFEKNYEVYHYTGINEALESDVKPDIVILDVNLDEERGYNYTSVLLEKFNVAIIAVSSDIERTTKYLMFKSGIIDYIEKPIDFELLKMKIQNILTMNKSRIIYGDLQLDIDSLMINKTIKLSKNEFIVLKYFMDNSENIIPKRDLLRLLWENDTFVEDTALNTLISRLRKKINLVSEKIEIKTIRNQGIKFGMIC